VHAQARNAIQSKPSPPILGECRTRFNRVERTRLWAGVIAGMEIRIGALTYISGSFSDERGSRLVDDQEIINLSERTRPCIARASARSLSRVTQCEIDPAVLNEKSKTPQKLIRCESAQLAASRSQGLRFLK
jgi:hypothetical protein